MKLLIAGAGFIVHDWLRITKDLHNTELIAIVATPKSESSLKKLQTQYGIKHIYTNYDQALKETEADTVYVAVPNSLHYQFVKKALLANKNVICEKPFTVNYQDFLALKKLAQDRQLILVEAITNQFLKNYREIKKNLPDLGKIHIVSLNYTQYSHRYDAFKQGKVLPVFDPQKGGGALMDLNVYNIHLVVGLFGKPKQVHYLANISKHVDTSGILTLDYGDFKAVLIAAKDSFSPTSSTIEGEKGAILVNGPTNVIDSCDLCLKDQQPVRIDHKIYPHRMYEEFVTFEKMIDQRDFRLCDQLLKHSDEVMQIVDAARKDASL